VPSVALVTPSHAFDAERLRFQRESFEAAGVDARHVVVVPPEDLAAFRGLPGAEVVATADVLPAEVEKARLRGRERWRRALPWNRDPVKAMSGWWTQQWVKLAVGERLGLDAWVCVDSDVFAVRPWDPFAVLAPRTELHELVDFPVGESIHRYLRDSTAFLGLDPSAVGTRRTYVGQATPIHGPTVGRMLRHVEGRTGLPWWAAMVRAGATEYTTYGIYARHVDGLRDLTPVDRRWCRLFFEYGPSFEDDLRRAVAEEGVVLGMLHSRLGVDPASYRDAVARVRSS
jgi:hypothetical protein